MHKVDNAIIMAAGMSSRLQPLTLDKPKGLIVVKDEVLIERMIRQLQEVGINKVIIVVGHNKEKYYYLKEKYGITIVENPYYKERNNYSSLYVAREYLKNSYICSSDMYYNENLFKSSEERPMYICEFKKGQTDEWCLSLGSRGVIKNFTLGGKDSWVLSSHAFFTKDFSKKLIDKLKETFLNQKKNNHFWENVYFENTDNLSLYIKKINADAVYEFDSLDELRSFDKSYINNTRSQIIQNISKNLKVSEAEIKNIYPIINSQDQFSGFHFTVKGIEKEYDYKKGII